MRVINALGQRVEPHPRAIILPNRNVLSKILADQNFDIGVEALAKTLDGNQTDTHQTRSRLATTLIVNAYPIRCV
jgi:hypothetical protein